MQLVSIDYNPSLVLGLGQACSELCFEPSSYTTTPLIHHRAEKESSNFVLELDRWLGLMHENAVSYSQRHCMLEHKGVYFGGKGNKGIAAGLPVHLQSMLSIGGKTKWYKYRVCNPAYSHIETSKLKMRVLLASCYSYAATIASPLWT